MLRQLRRRAPRLPPLQGNLPRLLQGRRRRAHLHDPRSRRRRPGNHRSGRKGRARQQGCGAYDLHQPRRPLSRPHAEQSARRRRLAPHRRRRASGTARHDGKPQVPVGHVHDRPHGRDRPQRRRAAVGLELPPQALGGDRRGRQTPVRTRHGRKRPQDDLARRHARRERQAAQARQPRALPHRRRVEPRRSRHPRLLPARNR